MQGRNRDADEENGLLDTVGGGEGGTNRVALTNTHYHVEKRQPVATCYKAQGAQLRAL